MGVEIRPIPRKFRSLVDHVLQPGEHVVWWGQPSQILYGWMPLFHLVATCSIYGAIFGWAAFHDDGDPFRWTLVAIGVTIVVLFVIVPLCGWFAILSSFATRLFYLLTGERAIQFLPNWRGDYAVLERRPEDLAAQFVRRFSNPFREIASFHWLSNGAKVEELVQVTLRPLLLNRLKHHDNEVRRNAILTAASFAAQGKLPLAILVEALRSEDSFIRTQAASALGRLGRQADPSLPDLRRIIFDEDHGVAQAALRSIEAISKAAAIEA